MSTSLERLAQAALTHADLTITESFLVPIGVGNLLVAMGTREQIAKLLSDEGMVKYEGKD